MKCPNCQLEGYIDGKKLIFEGDTDPNIETKAFYELYFVCQNPNCSNHGTCIGSERVQIS